MATSINNYAMSGRITRDAVIAEGKKGKIARFSIAHNFGKGMEPLFVDVVMYPTNGKKDIAIPVDALKQGNRVVVSGYLKPNVFKREDGTTSRRIDFVALQCEVSENDPAAATEQEVQDAEPEVQETAKPAKKATRK